MISSPTSPSPAENKPLIFFFAVLFFMCGADQFFTFRLGGLNFRWGQLLLLTSASVSLLGFWARNKSSAAQLTMFKENFLAWAPFVVLYGFSTLLSVSSHYGLLKLAWALCNIGGAILVCLNGTWSAELRKGFLYGALGIALFVWVQVLAIYGFGAAEMQAYGYPSTPLLLHIFGQSFPLGFVQPSNFFQDVLMLRPNVFYYEPSYAGCALSFLFPLLLILEKKTGLFAGWVSATGLTALLLIGSRAALLGCFITLVILFSGSFYYRLGGLRKRTLKVFVIATLMLLFFAAFQGGRRYLGFLAGPLGPRATYLKIQGTPVERQQFGEGNDGRSERGRIGNMKLCLSLWKEHLWWGKGVELDPQKGGIKSLSTNTWLEIGMESGLFGVLAFLYALFRAIRTALSSRPNLEVKVLLLSAWVTHFLVNLNLSQTFPRLDYWLLFYFSILLAGTYSKNNPDG